jgi:hypothetical protein
MTTQVVLGNREYPQGQLELDALLTCLRAAGPPYVFLHELIDPLIYARFGDLLRELDGKFEIWTSLAGYPGFRALKTNALGGDREFVQRCTHIHARHISPDCGGSLSLRNFFERFKHLVSGGFPVTLYLNRSVKAENTPFVLRDWFVQNDVVVAGAWEGWPATTSGRYGTNTCSGEHAVVGVKGKIHPCFVAAGSSFGRGVYAGRYPLDGKVTHDGRDKCSLRGCPNNEQDSKSFGSYQFLQPFSEESGDDAG